MSFTFNSTSEQSRLWQKFTLVEKWQQLVYENNALGYSVSRGTLQHYYEQARQNNDEVLLELILDHCNVPRETLALKERIVYYELLKQTTSSND